MAILSSPPSPSPFLRTRHVRTGTIQKLRGGTAYRVQVSAESDPVTGARIRPSKTVKTYAAAQRVLQELLAAAASGAFAPSYHRSFAKSIDGDKDTLASFVATWWPRKLESISPSTAAGYQSLLKLILPALGRRPLKDLSANEISAFISAQIGRGRSGTAGSAFILLKHILRTAVRTGELARNPMDGLSKPRKVHREMRVIGPGDWKLVREHLEELESPWLPAFRLALSTGLRRGELAGLRWEDLNPANNSVAVHRSLLFPRAGQVIVKEPKTARGRRRITLARSVMNMLYEHKAACYTAARRNGRTLEPTDYIFGHHDGTPWSPDSYSRAWKAVRKALGLDGIRLHDLRHSHASLMLGTGTEAHVVSRRLGHASVGFTLSTYAAVLPGRDGEAAEALEAMLSGAGKVVAQ